MANDSEAPRRGAPQGNQFAAKADGEKKDTAINFRLQSRQKSKWVKAAQKEGKKLVPWLQELADQRADDILKK